MVSVTESVGEGSRGRVLKEAREAVEEVSRLTAPGQGPAPTPGTGDRVCLCACVRIPGQPPAPNCWWAVPAFGTFCPGQPSSPKGILFEAAKFWGPRVSRPRCEACWEALSDHAGIARVSGRRPLSPQAPKTNSSRAFTLRNASCSSGQRQPWGTRHPTRPLAPQGPPPAAGTCPPSRHLHCSLWPQGRL